MRRDSSQGGLEKSLRDYVLVASFFATGRRERSIPIIKRGLLSGRLKERKLAELFLHLSLLLGFPAALEGLTILRSITGKSDSTRGPVKTRFSRGTLALKRVYGRTYDRLLNNLKSLHHALPGLVTQDIYGHVVSRPGLSLRDREVVNIAILTIQQLRQQLFSHIRGALRMGVSAKAIKVVIRLSARIGGVDPAMPLSMLSQLTLAQTLSD